MKRIGFVLLWRAVTDFQTEAGPVRASAFDRELAELMRRMHSLIRRFVRVGTGLQRVDIGNGSPRESQP